MEAIRINDVDDVVSIISAVGNDIEWFNQFSWIHRSRICDFVGSQDVAKLLWYLVHSELDTEEAAEWVLEKKFIDEDDYPYGIEWLSFYK